MKNTNVSVIGTLILLCICATTVFAQIPDPGDIPPYRLDDEYQITKMLEKGDELVATLKKAELKRDELLKKYGKKEIIVDGQKVITTQKPVPISELELLKPMLPFIYPESVNNLTAELRGLEHNLNNYLKKEPVNMSDQLKKQLTPQKAANTLTRVREQYGFISGKDIRGLYNTFESMGGDKNR